MFMVLDTKLLLAANTRRSKATHLKNLAIELKKEKCLTAEMKQNLKRSISLLKEYVHTLILNEYQFVY
jgi:uncharacterized iron-regulated protein